MPSTNLLITQTVICLVHDWFTVSYRARPLGRCQWYSEIIHLENLDIVQGIFTGRKYGLRRLHGNETVSLPIVYIGDNTGRIHYRPMYVLKCVVFDILKINKLAVVTVV